MDVVFLDANILFSAAYLPDSGQRRLWKLAGEQASETQLVTSAYAATEAGRNLLEAEQLRRLEELLASLKIVETPLGTFSDQSLPEGMKLPEKDRPIFLAAMEAGATHLLTGDFRHFGRYYNQAIAGILILPPAEYLRRKTERRAHP